MGACMVCTISLFHPDISNKINLPSMFRRCHRFILIFIQTRKRDNNYIHPVFTLSPLLKTWRGGKIFLKHYSVQLRREEALAISFNMGIKLIEY